MTNKVSLNFEFNVPAQHVLDSARKLLVAGNQDERDVAKALIDATNATLATRDALMNPNANFDLSVYFDIWLGDALEAADRLSGSTNPDVRYVVDCLKAQNEAIVKSKEAFLNQTKHIPRPK